MSRFFSHFIFLCVFFCKATFAGGYIFGVEGLYLQPTYNVDFYLNSFTTSSDLTQWNPLNPRWAWGYALFSGYAFDSGDSIDVSWYHQDRITLNTIQTNTASDPILLSTFLKPKWDNVSVLWTHPQGLWNNTLLHIYEGISFSRISTSYDANILGETSSDTFRTKWNGLGPKIGVRINHCANFLRLYAEAASSLFVGKSIFRTHSTGILDESLGDSSGAQRMIVPALEAKLGVRTPFYLQQGLLTLDMGYMWQNYFNAQQIITASGNHLNSDFSLNGPYLGFKYVALAPKDEK